MSHPSNSLPIAHQTCYQTFQQALQRARSQIANSSADSPVDLPTLKSTLAQLQSFFQTEILSLNSDDLEPAIAHSVQSYQVEMHKQLRLLITDLSFLQAARQADTIQQRRQQVGDRLETLIRYCGAVIGGEGDTE